MVGKTRHREYVDAIKFTKERLKVGSDYSPYLINRSLMNTPENVLLLNAVNKISVPYCYMDRDEQSLHEKQVHFDFLLETVKQTNPKSG